MRPEFPHDRIPVDRSDVGEATGETARGAAARDLIDLLAVIIGVCESLNSGLAQSPQHAELARVGLLAADRAVTLAAKLRAQPSAAQAATAPTPAAQARALALQAVAVAPVRKVLLVEDDPDLLNLLTAAFIREGFETYAAHNGRLGVDLLKTLQPDLMVTDIVMPEMEGIAAIIEARRASPHTRVIAISGGGHYGKSRNFLAWAHELGAEEVLAKPFRMSSLITAARVVLDRPAAPIPANETTPRRDALPASLQAHHR
ncbi:response regulator [Phenylobacterium sp.]|jgi:CheY-like chemotaxis protein|uniref:response regulator transcription factor n=1 Tax=Phenylobacterium sp. TaxID=1871053 RepID=UPI002F412323